MGAIVNALQILVNKVTSVATWFLAVCTQVFVDLWEFFTDIPVWIFDKLMSLVVTIVSAASSLPGFSSVASLAASVGTLPGDMLNLMGLLGMGTCLTIITSALLIRFTLGLIPFIRVGG